MFSRNTVTHNQKTTIDMFTAERTLNFIKKKLFPFLTVQGNRRVHNSHLIYNTEVHNAFTDTIILFQRVDVEHPQPSLEGCGPLLKICARGKPK